MTPLCYW